MLVEDEVEDKKKVIREHKTEIGERLYFIRVNTLYAHSHTTHTIQLGLEWSHLVSLPHKSLHKAVECSSSVTG